MLHQGVLLENSLTRYGTAKHPRDPSTPREGRDPDDVVTATRMVTGADVDYGALTDELLDSLRGEDGFSVHFFSRAQDLQREGDAWTVRIRDEKTGEQGYVQAKFVFIGAGGGALHLLQESGIPESRGYGGFPVSGIWLRCDNQEVSSRHNAKVYGKASEGSPPMSVPHLEGDILKNRCLCSSDPMRAFRQSF